MTEDDLKAVLAKYQQKAFELFNQNYCSRDASRAVKQDCCNTSRTVKET
jgi:hypothetical protein